MTPKFINSTPNPFHAGSNEEDHLQYHHFFGPSSSSSPSSHNLNYFNSTPLDHQAGCSSHHQDFYPSPHHLEGKEYVIGSYDESENKVGNGLVKLSPETNKVGKHEDQTQSDANKWMSSKMRVMQKMKSTDPKSANVITKTCNTSSTRREERKRPSSCMETEYYSSSISSSSNAPVRVCSDCNTTKTPLWRSGPKGPKSLCNACGIRQRKARRAMAAAAAAAAAGNDTSFTTNTETTPAVKIKVHHHKDKAKNNNNNNNNGVANTAATTVPFKKRCKVVIEAAAGSSSSSSSQEPAPPTPSKQKKLGNFEEYLIKLSKNLSLQHVFPQDEKEAAILLMAISCGLVHG